MEPSDQNALSSRKFPQKLEQLFTPEGATTYWNGFQPGQIQQTFTLPAPINSERAEANYADGVLTLHLPKAEHVKARAVKVTTKK